MHPPSTSIDDIIRLARQLSPPDKIKLIERLAPALEVPVTGMSATPGEPVELDDQYQRGYEQYPEDTADLEALLPHLPVPMEIWE